jgi:hypothetical protein
MPQKIVPRVEESMTSVMSSRRLLTSFFSSEMFSKLISVGVSMSRGDEGTYSLQAGRLHEG